MWIKLTVAVRCNFALNSKYNATKAKQQCSALYLLLCRPCPQPSLAARAPWVLVPQSGCDVLHLTLSRKNLASQKMWQRSALTLKHLGITCILYIKALIHILGIVVFSSVTWLVMRVHAPLQCWASFLRLWCWATQFPHYAGKPWQYPTAETPSQWISLGLKTRISPNATKCSREHLSLCMQCFAGCRMWTVLYLEWMCWHRWKWLLLSLLLHKLKREFSDTNLSPKETLPTLSPWWWLKHSVE